MSLHHTLPHRRPVQPRPTPLALAAALCSTAIGLAAPAQAQQRVEITGSAIKRTDLETAAPVEVLRREDIARTGATSINELIKSVAVIDILDTGEISSNSPGGSGTARVRLRALGETQTLVLINGRRVPGSPLQDTGGAGSGFNVNQIPVSAIERVEILKDGGSALYGADAVAGVVNFILRKDYTGFAGSASWGASSRSDGEEKQLSLTAGFGNLGTQRFNVLAALDVFKRDPILRKDRTISSTSDYRRYGPLPNFPNLDGRSSFAPEGNILLPSGVGSGLTVQPCPPERFTNNACRYDFNASLLTAYNGADRVSGLVNGSLLITPDLTGFVRWMGSQTKDHFEAHPVPDNFLLPDGRTFAGRFLQGGPRITDRTNDFMNIEAGVEGAIGRYDVKAGLSHGSAETRNQDSGYFDRTKFNLATKGDLAAGILPTIDVTRTDNPQAAVDALKVSPVRSGKATLDQADALVSGDLFKLPGGPVRFATGLSLWREKISDNPDPLQIANQVVGSIQQTTVRADRDAWAVFGELQLPFLKTLEGQFALRYDHYENASRSSPKFGLKWNALPSLALRASYSEAFKMPTLKQLYANPGQGAINLTEAQCTGLGLPAGCNGLAAFRLTGSTPTLKPELGKTWNLGVVLDNGPLSASVDFWQIDKKENIATPTLDQAIAAGNFRFDTTTNRWVITQNLLNFAVSKNAGVDLDARVRMRGTALGNVTVRGNITYYTTARTKNLPTDPWDEFNGTYAAPRWRSALTLTSEMGAWTTQLLLRGWGGFYDTPLQTRSMPANTRKVEKYDEWDLHVAWAGVKNLTLGLTVKNLFDRMPPFSGTNATNNNWSQQGFAELYTSRGRYYQLSAQYSY